MIKLSIIVPVFNKELYIDECINSILNQSFAAFELILVNDGSTDSSGKKCWHYAALDQRIVVIEQENKGVSEARNTGLAHARGEYIGFVDSDDTIEPDMYALLLANAQKNNADISCCLLRIVKDERMDWAAHDNMSVDIFNHSQALSAYLTGTLGHNANNKIYRASILENIRFEGVIYEDILFVCRVFLNSDAAVLVNAAKYNYIIRSNSVSMGSFNRNYLETVAVSAKIVELVALNDQLSLPQAMAFDVMANISLLNLLLLLANRNEYHVEYESAVTKLQQYHFFIKSSKAVRAKHRYAWLIFSFSPRLYQYCMRIYCRIVGSDAIIRTQ